MTALRLAPAFRQWRIVAAWRNDDRAVLQEADGTLHTFPLITLKRYGWLPAWHIHPERVAFGRVWLFTFGESGYLLDITKEEA